MIDIDGGQKSGSGTILRMAIAFSAITTQPLHIFNIRQKRPQSGLKPQHLEAVLTAAKLCNAKLGGANEGSHELWFEPRNIESGEIEARIGTAGSIPMLLMTVLPICACAENVVHLHISQGGTDVEHSPTINYVRFVLLPTLQHMGLKTFLTVRKYGYYPKGNGEVMIDVNPSRPLKAIISTAFGKVRSIKGASVCTYLADRNVAERQATAAKEYLAQRGCDADVQIINDFSNPIQKGSSIVLWVETDTNIILGADAIGKLGKTSETVGREAAEKLFVEIAAKPTVDAHLADILIPYMALADNKSIFLARTLTEHLQTNIWLSEKILNTKFNVKLKNGLYQIEKTR